MRYADYTTADSNRIKRWLQNRRLDDAVRITRAHVGSTRSALKIMDYGGGDGTLCHRFSQAFLSASVCCYEPSATMRLEAAEAYPGLEVLGSLASVEPHSYDVIVCCEVFEHLPDRQIDQALADISSLIVPSGLLVIGVPNEIYLAGLLKGVFRMARRYGAYDARFSTVLPAALGRPRTDRPVLKFEDLDFIFPHTGFDYRAIAAKCQAFGFSLLRDYPSPLWGGPRVLGTEIYLAFSGPTDAGAVTVARSSLLTSNPECRSPMKGNEKSR